MNLVTCQPYPAAAGAAAACLSIPTPSNCHRWFLNDHSSSSSSSAAAAAAAVNRFHHNNHINNNNVNVRASSRRRSQLELSSLEQRKHDLLKSIQDTQRGLLTTPEQRSAIEEALVCVEGYDAGSPPIDLAKLDGTWRLNYTSAPDVLVLFEAAARFPFLQVGQIFQKFECKDQSQGGIVRNVVRWSIQNLLEEQEGATLLVSAKFSLLSNRNIYLEFEEVAVENIKISEELQALIAPAVLPRSFLSLQILQFIRTFRAQVPVRSPERRSPGGLYYLSYLDRDMLLGRSVGGGGVFVFTRAQALT